MTAKSPIIGEYRLIYPISISEKSSVYVADNIASSFNPVILKLLPLSSEGKRRFEKECRLWTKVSGHGLSEPISCGTSFAENFSYIAYKAAGPSVAELQASFENNILTTDLALYIAYATSLTLDKLHARGWCHGDVKPGNVLLSADGSAVLTDIECAYPFNNAELGSEILDEYFMGTPAFISPEVWDIGSSATSPASDVWAIGVMLYLMLFGTFPFGKGDETPVRSSISKDHIAVPDDTPMPIRNLLNGLLAIDKASRISDAESAVLQIVKTMNELGYSISACRDKLTDMIKRLPLMLMIRLLKGEEGLDIQNIDKAKTDIVSHYSEAHVKDAQGVNVKTGADAENDNELEVSTELIAQHKSSSSGNAEPHGDALIRRSVVQWFSRMNPRKNFQFSIIFTGKKIKVTGGRGVQVTVGNQTLVLDPDYPYLDVEPSFPGCIVCPIRQKVDVSDETTTARFWITPLSEGKIKDASVKVEYRGRILDVISTPTSVVKRTTAKVLGIFGISLPIMKDFFQGLGFIAQQHTENYSTILKAFIFLSDPWRFIAVVTGILICASFLFFHTRPVQTCLEQT